MPATARRALLTAVYIGYTEEHEALRQELRDYYDQLLTPEVQEFVADSEEGLARLANVRARIDQFRAGLDRLGHESIPGEHPVVPLMVRDTERTARMVQGFSDNGVLVVGLNYPVVPMGDQTIRFQINAAHTEADIDEVLHAVRELSA